jgi:hypothetical protein
MYGALPQSISLLAASRVLKPHVEPSHSVSKYSLISALIEPAGMPESTHGHLKTQVRIEVGNSKQGASEGFTCWSHSWGANSATHLKHDAPIHTIADSVIICLCSNTVRHLHPLLC